MLFHRLSRVLALVFATTAAGPLLAQPVSTPESTYDAQDAWLCRPGRSDACSTEQAMTRIAADGTRTVVTFKPAADAPIDCFYVYPTISQDPNPHSTLQAGPGELRAVAQQFAPFASVCRPFAPMYRQVTLAGLRAAMMGNPAGINPELPVADVQAAWRHYLARDNQGRGVVLIGHSQGSRMLTELLKRDVEGQPAQRRVVSALLIGSNVLVPTGADTGGTLRSMPVCTSGTQTGCVVAYTTFRASAPPPANTRFGRSTVAGTEVACTDPVRLSGVPLRSLLWREATLLGQPALRGEWEQAMAGVTTPFVDLPGLMDASCVKADGNHYLAVRFDPAARGQRPADIPGDLVVEGRTFDDWGLHLIDVNIVMGNLLALVRRQGEAWRARGQ
ncbi:DUF3089 domain-containing protein [Ramlibacter sp.]|uniref:DUF3089 domain-containing protein n=1 Tax=Ramlibacter sp. TaxID=1917967 RepID=UPI0035B3A069